MTEQVFPADLDAFEKVNAFAEEILEMLGVKYQFVVSILIAIEEIFVNVARYAYPDGNGEVSIAISTDNGKCIIRFEDSGIPFNPLEKEDPDVQMSADDRKIGGLGIYMVKNSMDNVIYQFVDGKNILTIEKNIS